jgi:Xaa-Pro dipeptidase
MPSAMDRERLGRLVDGMKRAGLDGLVCRLPENVLYLTGYWPVIGASTAVLTKEGEVTLIPPFSELDYVRRSWVEDVRSYRFVNMAATANPNRDTKPVLEKVAKDKGLTTGRIGYEGSFELVAANNVAGEARVFAESTLRMLRESIPGATLCDATPVLLRARAIKSAIEVEQLRRANEIAAFGYEVAAASMRAGVAEAAIAGDVEARIYGAGVGYKGTERARGFCFAMSGPNAANSWRPFCMSTAKTLEEGEPVLVELNTVADGYFSDLTRTFVVGEPDARTKTVFKAVRAAIDAVIAAVRPGVKARDLDALARASLTGHGFGDKFPHQLGHGTGLQFHDPCPTLHPASEDVLEEGMVLAVEPAVYIEGWGGVRMEENVVVTAAGCDSLCSYPRGGF